MFNGCIVQPVHLHRHTQQTHVYTKMSAAHCFVRKRQLSFIYLHKMCLFVVIITRFDNDFIIFQRPSIHPSRCLQKIVLWLTMTWYGSIYTFPIIFSSSFSKFEFFFPLWFTIVTTDISNRKLNISTSSEQVDWTYFEIDRSLFFQYLHSPIKKIKISIHIGLSNESFCIRYSNLNIYKSARIVVNVLFRNPNSIRMIFYVMHSHTIILTKIYCKRWIQFTKKTRMAVTGSLPYNHIKRDKNIDPYSISIIFEIIFVHWRTIFFEPYVSDPNRMESILLQKGGTSVFYGVMSWPVWLLEMLHINIPQCVERHTQKNFKYSFVFQE